MNEVTHVNNRRSELEFDQMFKLLEMSNRVVRIDRRVRFIGESSNRIQQEAKNLNRLVSGIYDDVADGLDVRIVIADIERRIVKIEESVFAVKALPSSSLGQ